MGRVKVSHFCLLPKIYFFQNILNALCHISQNILIVKRIKIYLLFKTFREDNCLKEGWPKRIFHTSPLFYLSKVSWEITERQHLSKAFPNSYFNFSKNITKTIFKTFFLGYNAFSYCVHEKGQVLRSIQGF